MCEVIPFLKSFLNINGEFIYGYAIMFCCLDDLRIDDCDKNGIWAR